MEICVGKLHGLLHHVSEGITGKRHPLQPPKGLIFTGGGDYLAAGQEFLEYFKKYADLQPHHKILDVGSGMGRMAVPLTEFLNKNGSYEGFDIVEEGVIWCQKKITKAFPNFRCQHVSLENDWYSNNGDNAANFKFPYPDGQFDFVFLTSVFTHMMPEEVAHYLTEIQRVLKNGGHCLATFFIINDDAKQKMNENKNFQFPHDFGNYFLMDKNVKAANIAFEESYLEGIIIKAGLKKKHQINGFWCEGKKREGASFQDILIFKKK